jgi:hypothetical protein
MSFDFKGLNMFRLDTVSFEVLLVVDNNVGNSNIVADYCLACARGGHNAVLIHH